MSHRVWVGLIVLALVAGPAAAQPCPDCLEAGAARVAVHLPTGVPLGGYGSVARRAWIPDLLGRHPHAFWFRPSEGARDELAVRALVLQSGSTRVRFSPDGRWLASSGFDECIVWDAKSWQVRRRIADSEKVTAQEVSFYIHSILMRDLEAWAGRAGVPFVDMIHELDQNRDVLVSWVHLSAEGNRMIADRLASEILASPAAREWCTAATQ